MELSRELRLDALSGEITVSFRLTVAEALAAPSTGSFPARITLRPEHSAAPLHTGIRFGVSCTRHEAERAIYATSAERDPPALALR